MIKFRICCNTGCGRVVVVQSGFNSIPDALDMIKYLTDKGHVPCFIDHYEEGQMKEIPAYPAKETTDNTTDNKAEEPTFQKLVRSFRDNTFEDVFLYWNRIKNPEQKVKLWSDIVSLINA